MGEDFLYGSPIYTGEPAMPWQSATWTGPAVQRGSWQPYTISTSGGIIHHSGLFHTDRTFDEKTLELERKEDESIMSERSKDPISSHEKHSVCCHDKDVLRPDNILKLLSKMKGRLQIECMPVKVDHVECLMSPIVKENIIQAYRRVAMYGKKTPFVARFDEYGNRLSDEVLIDTLKGVNLKIVDPDVYGEYFLQFTGIVRPYYEEVMYKPSFDTTYISDDSLPF